MMKRSLGGKRRLYFIISTFELYLTHLLLPCVTGVVDAHLLVYNTTNLRVVDASILPMQISAHLQSTLYGVAEKAADLIKAAQ